VGTSVELAHPAKELGLESAEGRNVQWIGARPRGTIRVSELLRSRLRTSDGWRERIGLSPEAEPAGSETFIHWESLLEIAPGVVSVGDRAPR
jgi:hypothetical protein